MAAIIENSAPEYESKVHAVEVIDHILLKPAHRLAVPVEYGFHDISFHHKLGVLRNIILAPSARLSRALGRDSLIFEDKVIPPSTRWRS
jgi:hypothetical protein